MKNNHYILRKQKVVFDVESGPNHWHCGFKSLTNGKVIQIETPLGKDECLSKEDIKRLKKLMMTYTVMGFNSENYDMPAVKKALTGATNFELYEFGSNNIQKKIPGWQSSRGLPFLRCTHIDLSLPAPGVMISLKKYGARLHSKKIQDLPYDYDKYLTQEEHELNKLYNINDLDTTIDLYNYIEKAIDLRYKMSDKYKMDLMSKGDAQIAEAVIVAELLKKGISIEKFKAPKNYSITYVPPKCISYISDELTEFFEKIQEEKFLLYPGNGSIKLPTWIGKPIIIGKTKFKLGIGGIHSQEKSLVAIADEKYVIKNCDVSSYYPSMIIEYGFYPKSIGKQFLTIYSDIKVTRLKHKAAGEADDSESLKLVLNGTFGKFGSKWSKIYAPDLMLHVTLTGQLLLLMLIEELEDASIQVLSSNTDGIEYKVLRSREAEAEEIIENWSKKTKMDMEHGKYNALYARDVNNYVALYDKEPKAKGAYSKPDIRKDAEFQIVYTAIREYLHKGISIHNTINECEDVREFIACKNVAGGGEWKGERLGKVVRWYYSRKYGEQISYMKEAKRGHKVATTDYAIPIMQLPEGNKIPELLDKKYYIYLALKHLEALGVDYLSDDHLYEGDL